MSPLPSAARVLPGIGATILAWLLFALHDASVKLLVADMSAWQVLFTRSALIGSACLLVSGRGAIGAALAAPRRGRLVQAAVVYALAWVAYYAAARDLPLAELETIYYASPIMTTLLAMALLKEHVPAWRWLALLVGFAGVVLACRPHAVGDAAAVGLVLLGAALWAYAVVLLRQVADAIGTVPQMLLNSLVFLLMSVAAAPWWWRLPLPGELVLLLAVGAIGLLAQYLLYEGIRMAPASVVAPLEYTGLVWAFALGYVIWGDVPPGSVFLGATLIALGGLVTIALEWRQERRAAPPAGTARDRVAVPAGTQG
jgi:drug/metabolite transporter (DMT)-like permease